MSDANAVAARLRERVSGTVEVGALLAPLTTYRVGGAADVLVEAERDEDLVEVARAAAGLDVAVVGRGSNLLVSDDGFRGIAVRLGRSYRRHERTGAGLVFGGSVYLPAAAKLTARLGLGGFEFAAEIPATFGGAVRMNAGAHGRSMADCLVWADVVDLADGSERRVTAGDLGYSYRHSSLPPAAVVVRGEVALHDDDGAAVGRRISELLRWRREHQPAGRSAGSIFKNPEGDSAGRLIEAAGAKGWRCGGAQVSEVHANFIVADPDAAATDVWRLIEAVRAEVRQTHGVELELEVKLLGRFPQVSGNPKEGIEVG